MNILDFPEDCTFLVFSQFSYMELLNCSLVCQDWYHFSRTNFLWKDLYTQEFCKSSKPYFPHDTDYLQFFQHSVSQDARWLQGKCSVKIHDVHKHSVRGVSFSPKVPYLLASSGYDSAAHIFNVNNFPTPQKSFHLGAEEAREEDIDRWARFARVKWTCDGLSLAVTSSSAGDVYLYDVETSEKPFQIYKDVSSTRLDRTAMAAHPQFPYLLAVAGSDRENRNGGNISLIDTRVPNGLVRLMAKVHNYTVRDIEWVKDDELLTSSPDGAAKITNLEGQTHTTVRAAYRASDTSAYEGILSVTKYGNSLALGCGGCVEIWDVTHSAQPVIIENVEVPNGNLPLWRLKYNKRGTILYAADDDGFVRVFHRKKSGGSYVHIFMRHILNHVADVSDLDISIDEQYLASASQSREVGLASLLP